MDKICVFKSAVRKAEENGFARFVGEDDARSQEIIRLIYVHPELFFDARERWAIVLYDNEFCRRFWGTTYVVPIGKLWEYHRRRMLFSADPFRYIARYL